MDSTIRNLTMKLRNYGGFLVAPSSSLQDEIEIQRAKLRSALQLALFLLFLIPAILAPTVFGGVLSIGMPVILAAAYLIGRTKNVRLSSAVTLGAMSILPYYIILSSVEITSERLFGTLAWIPWIILFASFISGPVPTISLAAANFLALLLLPNLHSELTFSMMGFPMAFLFAMAIVIILGLILRESDLKRVLTQRLELTRQNNEFDLFISLLRHDFQNDIGVILGTIDLVLIESKEETTRVEMRNIEALGERMIHLLSLLSSTSAQVSPSDTVSMIEKVASQAMRAHPNLQVRVVAEENSRNTHSVGSRLLPLVFENLFRNSASYAGDNPFVTVTILREGNHFIIDVLDNGPGVNPVIQEHLFERGASTRGPERGLGLYLSKKVIVSLGGSMEYQSGPRGAAFRLRLKAL